jgi:hypothetical protein
MHRVWAYTREVLIYLLTSLIYATTFHRKQLSIYQRDRTLLETFNKGSLQSHHRQLYEYSFFFAFIYFHTFSEVQKLFILRGVSTTTTLSVLQVYILRSYSFSHVIFILVDTSRLIVFIYCIYYVHSCRHYSHTAQCAVKKPFKQTNPIPDVADCKFLGLIFDRKLNFISHIKYVKAMNLLNW